MIRKAQSPDTSSCPVPEEMLGRLYRAPDERIVQTVSTLPPVQRARLAVFCYGRAHLHEMAMAIASTCDRETLVDIAHRVGEAVYVQSRERRKQVAAPEQVGRRSITLARSAASGEAPRPFVDEPLEDIDSEENGAEPAVELEIVQHDARERAQELAVPALAVGF